MKPLEKIDWTVWPSVPRELRPKKLYYASTLTPTERAALVVSGWDPQDVRLLPAETDNERGVCVKAWLEGIRNGSIALTDGVAKYVELEAKIYGLLTQKEQHQVKPLDATTLDELLSVGDKWTSSQTKLSSKKSVAPEKEPSGKEP